MICGLLSKCEREREKDTDRQTDRECEREERGKNTTDVSASEV